MYSELIMTWYCRPILLSADAAELNTHFGTMRDLLDLSAALHERGMYLMVDVVGLDRGSLDLLVHTLTKRSPIMSVPSLKRASSPDHTMDRSRVPRTFTPDAILQTGRTSWKSKDVSRARPLILMILC